MYKKALSSLTILYFMMGFITCLNGILIPYLKKIFDLSYTQAALIQFCFFGAYGLVSIPASRIIEHWGYHKTMVSGFAIAALGCLLFFPAVSYHRYEIFLVAIFVLASGIVLLQVTANPYVSFVGTKETASSRLTMVQAFNSFGTFLAPFFGSFLILDVLPKAKTAGALRLPYTGIALILLIISVIVSKLHLPEIKDGTTNTANWKKVLNEPGLFSGMFGIFAYVGAEVAIGSYFINYVIGITSMEATEAASMLAIFWLASMAGRFLGFFTLKEFSPGRVLSVHAILALALILISTNSRGIVSVYTLILVGFCNSIMFPTIFTLAVKNLKIGEEQKASGLLSTSIIGGALIPLLTGYLVDAHGFRAAFLLPVLCYGYIALFGLRNNEAKELTTQNAH